MITKDRKHKTLKFQCENCGYTVSNNANSDFSVEDFAFCPYCGKRHPSKQEENNALFLRVIACEVMTHQTKYPDDLNHMFSKGVQAYVITLERKIKELKEEN